MVFEKYLEFLAGIDIAIFNHKRQQAFGNAITLLGLGKKVFIHNDSTLNGVFQEFDIAIYDTANINIDLIDENVQKQNIERVMLEFSEEALVKSVKLWIE